MTEMLKDERGGGEIISHYKSRERVTPWSSGAEASTQQLCSSPASPELSHVFLLLFLTLFSPLCQPNKLRNAMRMTFEEDVTAGSS